MRKDPAKQELCRDEAISSEKFEKSGNPKRYKNAEVFCFPNVER